MTETKLKIMINAVKIRIGNGEKLDKILASYPALTKEDKKAIKSALN